jgi:septal ring factor EnvC (AmiA/AmiB activator)
MSKTAFDKKQMPDNLNTIKVLIDERQSANDLLRKERNTYNAGVDSQIKENDEELKTLRIHAADLLGINTNLKPREGVVERGSAPVKEEVKEEVKP